MMKIKLTQEQVALIDDEDFDLINKYKWCAHKKLKTFYAETCTWLKDKKKCRYVGMHRIIMNVPDGLEVDHINHNGLDNRKENLRIVSHRKNLWNRSDQGKFIGVSRSGSRYKAAITINGVYHYIGNYKTPEDAHFAYLETVKTIENE